MKGYRAIETVKETDQSMDEFKNGPTRTDQRLTLSLIFLLSD